MIHFTPRHITLKNKEQVTIRAAVPEDAAALIGAISAYVRDSPSLLLTPEEFKPGLEQEQEWIRSFAASGNSLLLVALWKEQIIGNIDLTGSPRKKLQHTAVVGMGMLKEWRNQGLGTALLQAAIDWAIAHPVLEQLWLQVFHDNAAAIALYSRCGFRIQGRQTGFIRTAAGSYADNIIMGRSV